jgi:hypothetical protein
MGHSFSLLSISRFKTSLMAPLGAAPPSELLLLTVVELPPLPL